MELPADPRNAVTRGALKIDNFFFMTLVMFFWSAELVEP
jgi:hypothetical protein